MDKITNVINGRFSSEDFADLDSKVEEYCIIKYPQVLNYAKSKQRSFACDLSRLIHYGKKPLLSNHYLTQNIPIDCLPVPPKDIVENLDGSWDFYRTAWAILGDYNITNMNVYYDHIELAYRNNKSWEHLKVNKYQDDNSNLIRLGDRSILDKPRIEGVFELFYSEVGLCPPEITKIGLFDNWNKDLNRRYNTPMISSVEHLCPTFADRPIIDKPWHKNFYNGVCLTKEVIEWLEIAKDYPRTKVLDDDILTDILNGKKESINILIRRILNADQPTSVETLVMNVVLVLHSNKLTQNQIDSIKEKVGEVHAVDEKYIMIYKESLVECENIYILHLVMDDEFDYMYNQHQAMKYGIVIHRDSPIDCGKDITNENLLKKGCIQIGHDYMLRIRKQLTFKITS